ncbi:MAG: hypothetical protein IJR70_05905 [Eubacterium sp.]|nr:hypothetical protein [Eubacterium sp.]
MKKICILALIACAFLAGCGNTDSDIDVPEITTQTTEVTTSAPAVTTSAPPATTSTSLSTSKTTTTAKVTTTTKKTTKATTTTKRTRKVTTTKATTVATQAATQPVYYNDPEPTYYEPEPVVTTTTKAPVVTTTTTTTTAKATTPKSDPAPEKTSEGTDYSKEIPPGWNPNWTYDPPYGKEYTKASVMKEFNIDSKTYDAYEALIRGTSTKAQRLLVRDDCIKYTIDKYGAQLDEGGYCFQLADGTPTCDTTKADDYGPCEFGGHGETSMITPDWIGGFKTLASCTRLMIYNSRGGADDIWGGLKKNDLFNVQVVYYGLDPNLGTIPECAVIVFGSYWGRERTATEQTY